MIHRRVSERMCVMKSVASILVLVFCVSSSANAQQATSGDEMVTVKKSDLTTEQQAKIENKQVVEQLSAYKEYAEIGKGIGAAVGESLRSVKDVAIDFSQTPVGKFTLFLIAWKVMAKDVIAMGNKIVGYGLGIPLFFISGVVLVWSYRRQCFPRRVLVEKTAEGKKWAMFTPDGRLISAESTEDMEKEIARRTDWAAGHVIVALIAVVICSIITFGC